MQAKNIVHQVYFTLEEASDSKIESLLQDMKSYLSQHPGLVYFSCGTLNLELKRPVNDQAFHVSLHTVFTNRAAHDDYQADARHAEFIQRNRHNWKQVRVFDSDVE